MYTYINICICIYIYAHIYICPHKQGHGRIQVFWFGEETLCAGSKAAARMQEAVIMAARTIIAVQVVMVTIEMVMLIAMVTVLVTVMVLVILVALLVTTDNGSTSHDKSNSKCHIHARYRGPDPV